MQEIIITTVVIGVIGLIIGIALVAAGKKFYVAVDEKAIAIRECLPGNNCGACGYAGCDAVAAAIAAGDAPVNACPHLVSRVSVSVAGSVSLTIQRMFSYGSARRRTAVELWVWRQKQPRERPHRLNVPVIVSILLQNVIMWESRTVVQQHWQD